VDASCVFDFGVLDFVLDLLRSPVFVVLRFGTLNALLNQKFGRKPIMALS
jgi:hypothetical protein